MALRYARQRVHLREVVLRDKPDELLQASAQGTVPVLVLTNGEVIDESRDIMIWALEQNDRDGWLSVLVEEQAALIDLNDQRFKPLLDGYKYPGRHAKLDSPGCFQRALELFINPLEGQLKTQAFLFGSDMQLADVAVFPFVRQFDGVDKHALTEQD